MSYGITPKQLKALRFVAAHIEQNGHSPSYAEIATALSLASRGNAHGVVGRLVERGHLNKMSGGKRGLVLTQAAEKLFAKLRATTEGPRMPPWAGFVGDPGTYRLDLNAVMCGGRMIGQLDYEAIRSCLLRDRRHG